MAPLLGQAAHVVLRWPAAPRPAVAPGTAAPQLPLRPPHPIYDGDDETPVTEDFHLDILTPQETMSDDLSLRRQIVAEALDGYSAAAPIMGLLHSGGPSGSKWIMLTDPEASATTLIVAMLADPFLDAAPLSTDRIIEAMSKAAKAELRNLRFVVFIPVEVNLPPTLAAPQRRFFER